MDAGQPAPLWPAVVQAGLIVAGWWAVHALSARRDRDKARREMRAKAAEGLGTRVTALQEDCLTYHTSERDEKLERKIKAGLQDLGYELEALRTSGAEVATLAACRAALVGLRRAATGRHFEDEHQGAWPHAAPELSDMAGAALDLKRRLLAFRFSQFADD